MDIRDREIGGKPDIMESTERRNRDMAKRSYADVKRQVNALLEQQRKMEQQAIDVFMKALMKSDAGEKLVELPSADLQAVAKLVAAELGGLIEQVQADREAKTQQSQVPVQSPVRPPNGGYQYAG